MTSFALRRFNITGLLALVIILISAGTVTAAPGDLDPGFDGDGKVLTAFSANFSQDYAFKLLLQPDGKLVAVGYKNPDNLNYNVALARYNTDGTLDPGFGSGGKVLTDFGVGRHDVAYDAALQSDGKILIVGEVQTDAQGFYDFLLARYNTDGTVDTTFGSGGKITADFFGLQDRARAMLIQADGKILVAGSAGDGGTFPGAFGLIRFNADGTPDSTFGTGGKVTTDMGGSDYVTSLAVQTDGKIIAAGYSEFEEDARSAMARYDTNGNLDPTFGNNGIGDNTFTPYTDVSVVSGGKILASGGFAVIRYQSNGARDATFGTSGIAAADFPAADESAQDMIVQPDGKIVLAGHTSSGSNGNTQFNFALARFTGEGSSDTGFGAGGKLSTDIAGGPDLGFSMVQQPDGKIVVAGWGGPVNSGGPGASNFGLVRYLAGGVAPVNISGRVTLNNSGLGSVLVTLTGGDTSDSRTTDSAGNYSFSVPTGGTYTVTPSRAGYAFDPSNRTLDNVQAAQTADFVAQRVNIAPTAELTSPRTGATYIAPATVPLRATAADADGNVARVDFYANSLLVGTDATSPYEAAWFVTAPGAYNLTAIAIDNDGGATTSAAATIVVITGLGGGTNGLQYYPLPNPVRLLDTRAGQAACDAPGTPLTGGQPRTQNARGACGGSSIPGNAQAIVGNATVVNDPAGATAGYVTLYPDNVARPTVSNLNFSPGQTIPNSFTVGLGPTTGAFNIYSSSNTNFIVDVTGYYAPPTTGGLYYHTLPRPFRLLDTRAGQTACDAPGTPLVGGTSRAQAARRICDGVTVPSSAKVLVGNATAVVGVTGGVGFITLYPGNVARPNVSNTNFVTGDIVANSFTVGLDDDGAFNIYASTTADFIADVTGYYSDQASDENGTGYAFYPLTSPLRLLDTRPGQAACDAPGVALTGGQSRTENARVTCNGATIPEAAQALVGNATVVNNTAGQRAGFVTLYPGNVALPSVSNINYVPGQIVPNAFIVGLGPAGGSTGAFNIYPFSTLHFIVDISGYFAP